MYYTYENVKKMNTQALLRAEERSRTSARHCLEDPFFGLTALSMELLKEHVNNLVLLVMEKRKRGLDG